MTFTDIQININSVLKDKLNFINSIGVFQLSFFSLLSYSSFNHSCPYCKSIDFINIYTSINVAADFLVICYICQKPVAITSFGVDLNVHFPHFVYI